jgi:UDP-glucose 4-epimerase
MTSLITGATGFIGKSLLYELVSRGERVIAVSRRPQLGEPNKLASWRLFPTDSAGWSEILETVSTVYHLAWSSLPRTSNEDPISDAKENILSTLSLLEAVRRKNTCRLVFASSGGTVYGVLQSVPASEKHRTHPRCAYGVSKLTIEKYLALYHDLWGLDCIALRISNPYGPRQEVGRNFGAVATFATCVARGEPITIFGDGTITRDYIYIDDLIEAIIAAGRHRGGPTVLNVGSGVGRSLNDIVDILREKSKRKIDVNYLQARDLDVPVSVLDISLAETLLNWKPRTSFEKGLEATLEGRLTAGHTPPALFAMQRVVGCH